MIFSGVVNCKTKIYPQSYLQSDVMTGKVKTVILSLKICIAVADIKSQHNVSGPTTFLSSCATKPVTCLDT